MDPRRRAAVGRRDTGWGVALVGRLAGGEIGFWERGRLAGGAALARVTLTLALSRKGRGDPLTAIHT